jgi:uncharacterized repeat protein (TIGR01451 family)
MRLVGGQMDLWGKRVRHMRARTIISSCAIGVCLGMAGQAHATGTVAGTNIDNLATATFDLPGGGSSTVTSNTVTLKVDELLDVTLASADPGDVTTSPSATNQILKFTLTNTGNGNEKFALSAVDTAGGDDFNPAVTSIVIDANGNNAYDAGIDTVYVAGSNEPDLAPDTSVTVFVLSTIPAGVANSDRGRIDLSATAMTGSGAPGTSFAGQGQGGGDAVVGVSGAQAGDDGYFVVSSATLSLTKSASVADPFGGSTQVPGATITYTLVAAAAGSGSVANVQVGDSIPAGTSYKPNSLTLDAIGLTDATDGDAGRFNINAITVGLGSVAAGSSHTITFQVSID